MSLKYDLTIEGIPWPGLSGLQPLLVSNLRWDRQGFVIIHVGANDMGKMSEDKWQNELGRILSYIGVMYPGYKLVLSGMLPCNKWRHGPSDVKDKKKNDKNSKEL